MLSSKNTMHSNQPLNRTIAHMHAELAAYILGRSARLSCQDCPASKAKQCSLLPLRRIATQYGCLNGPSQDEQARRALLLRKICSCWLQELLHEVPITISGTLPTIRIGLPPDPRSGPGMLDGINVHSARTQLQTVGT